MKTTRKKIIRGKIFTKENVRSLWAKIKSEYDNSQKDENHSSIEIEINCGDGISYESETDDLIQDGDVIDNKRCSTINIEYHDYKQERRISLNISHGDDYGNGLIVRGDKNWVAGTFDSLNDIIESAKPQEHWFVKYKTLILHLGAITFGYFVYKLLDLIPISTNEEPSTNVMRIRDFLHSNIFLLNIIKVISFWLQGIFPLWWLRDWVLKLWPSVEFDFGPEHKKTEKNRRKRLGLFFSIIIIPLILNLIYDWLTK